MAHGLADNQFIVSQFGVTSKAAPPSGLGPYSLGDIYPSAYIDVYRRIRWPTRAEMVAQYRNSVFICAQINAQGVAKTPLKLYVETRTGDPRPKCRVKSLSKRHNAWVRGEDRYARVKSSSSMSGRVAGDADVEEVPDHPILDLFGKPNPYHSCSDIWKLLSNYLDVVGTGYWWIGDKTKMGTPKGIWPLPSHLLYPWREFPESKELISYWLFTAGRFQIKVPVENVIDFKVADLWEPYSRGLSPTVGVWEHVNVNEKMLGHTQNMLDNQARPDAVLTPDTMIGEFERERLERRMNSKFRGGGFGSVLVTEESMKLQPLSWSPADLAGLEVHQQTFDMVCHAYGVPLALVTKETNMANLQAARSQHAELGIWPRLITRDETLNRLLVTLYDDSGRLFLASDNPVPDDEEMDLKKRVEAVKSGWQTRHEARTEDGMEEVEWAKKPTLPTAQQVLDDSGRPMPPPLDPNKPKLGPNGSTNGKPSGNSKKPKKAKKKKGKKKAARIADLLRLTEAVQEGEMTLCLARDIVAKSYGEERAILFDESLKTLPTRPVKKEIDVADPMAQRALERLDNLPRLIPDDPDDQVPVPFPIDEKPGYPVEKVLKDEEWLAQPMGTFWLRELSATQPLVKRAKVRQFILDPDITPRGERGEFSSAGMSVPHVVRYAADPENAKSKLYIDNGHHHATALWLLGRSEVNGRYLDLTKGREAVSGVSPDPNQPPASTYAEPKDLQRALDNLSAKIDHIAVESTETVETFKRDDKQLICEKRIRKPQKPVQKTESLGEAATEIQHAVEKLANTIQQVVADEVQPVEIIETYTRDDKGQIAEKRVRKQPVKEKESPDAL